MSRLLIGYDPAAFDEQGVDAWLEQVFDPRYDRSQRAVLLESVGAERLLKVELVDATPDEIAPEIKERPRLVPPAVVWFNSRPKLPESTNLPEDYPPVVCMHAYKGGVGRTTTMLALALGLAEKPGAAPVLLVDFDLEAPGLSILYHSRQPNPQISAADVLALVHSDPSPDCEDTVELVAERLRDQIDHNIIVLPSFRWDNADQVGSAGELEISPDNLTVSTKRSPYQLGTLLARIGARVGAGIVLVDLRAGFSDLATALLLDPRLAHIQLTSLNGQALAGTRSVLRRLGELANHAPQSMTVKLPAIVLNQIPMVLQGTAPEAEAIESLQEVIYECFPRPSESTAGEDAEQDLNLVEADQPVVVAKVGYSVDLAAISSDWEKAIASIKVSQVINIVLRDLEGFLPSPRTAVPRPTEHRRETTPASTDELARKLQVVASRLVFAEKAAEIDFLKTQALRKLADDAYSTPPYAVLVGARGAGKTFTCMRMIAAGNWRSFVETVTGRPMAVTGEMLPIFWSPDLEDEPMQTHRARRQSIADRLDGGSPPDLTEMQSAAETAFSRAESAKDFRDIWLRLIALSAGCGDWNDFAARLDATDQRVVAVVDGFERLFANFQGVEWQQKAVRSMLQDIPSYLRQLPGRRVGLIVATRLDIVKAAIQQNVEQFLNQYSQYRLRWNWSEASALVAWVASNAEIIRLTPEEIAGFPLLSQAEREDILRPLWGYKIGPDHSKEARSLEWVMSYLSDFNGQLQARDLIRFLSTAAEGSIEARRPDDRVLAPSAMRNAIEYCSSERVKEIQDENDVLREIFSQIRQTRAEFRFTPMEPSDLARFELTREQLDALEVNGALFLSKGEYHVPEIIRVGLGFRYAGGARKKVVSLMREAALKAKGPF